MTLTEQLYEGTLPTGWYYFNNGHESYIVKYDNINTKHWKLQEPEGITVLCKVPTYEEYRNLQHCWVEELEENGQLKEQQETLEDAYNELVCINANLEDNCKTLAQKLLQVKPKLKEWLEVNFREYL